MLYPCEQSGCSLTPELGVICSLMKEVELEQSNPREKHGV